VSHLSRKLTGSNGLVGKYGHVFAKNGSIKSSFKIVYHLHDGRYIIQDADKKQTPITEAELLGPQIKIYRKEKFWRRAYELALRTIGEDQ